MASDAAVGEVVDGIARTMYALGVRTAFGMPGGDSLPLIRALQGVGVRFVLVRDEASAGFAADATAQLTGTVGLCVSTLGPGLTNLASGVAGCTLDRAPVLAVTSRYRTDRHGTYTHMMLDQSKILDGTGKDWFRLTAANAAGELRRALAVARAPRPGAVWLEVPTEVAAAPWEGPALVAPPPLAAPAPVPDAVVDAVARWSRPVVLAGFGALQADLARLADALRAPVLTSYKAKGVLPEGRGWSAGAAGLSPVVDAHHRTLIDQADGLLLVGWDPVELRDHWLPGWRDAGGPEVVVLDSHVPTDLPARIDVVHAAPVGPAVADLAARLDGASRWTPAEVDAHREGVVALHDDGMDGPATAVRAVQAALDGHGADVVVALDVGAHRITASNVWRCDRPSRLLQSNGWASMGYGLPAGLAANAAGLPAVVLTGDMGLQLVLGELGTAAELGGDLVVVVLLDQSLSLIELKQERLGHPTAGVRFGNPELASLARAFGGHGVEVAGPLAVQQAVAQALEVGGLHIVGVRIDPAGYRRQM